MASENVNLFKPQAGEKPAYNGEPYLILSKKRTHRGTFSSKQLAPWEASTAPDSSSALTTDGAAPQETASGAPRSPAWAPRCPWPMPTAKPSCRELAECLSAGQLRSKEPWARGFQGARESSPAGSSPCALRCPFHARFTITAVQNRAKISAKAVVSSATRARLTEHKGLQ